MNDYFPNTSRLVTEIENVLREYKIEDNDFKNSNIFDVYLVGSILRDDFTPYESDLDIVVILCNSPYGPVVLGFDSYLCEDYQNILKKASEIPISKVDVGVYSAKEYQTMIEDNNIYSCMKSQYISL